MEKEKTRIKDWMPAIELGIVLVTILGSTIPLYLHTDAKLHAEMEKQTQRTDRLYEMFIELLKESK